MSADSGSATERPITLAVYEVDRKPATWVMGRSLLRERWIWLGCAVSAVAALGALVALSFGYHLSALISALFLIAFIALRPRATSYVDRHLRMLNGAMAEQRVGDTLSELRRDGWIVMHDIEQRGEGNIDHIASGPNGVYLVETKAHRYRDRDLVKAKRQAAKLHDEIGVWVTPVICLDSREGSAFEANGVAIVPRRQLLVWLGRQRNRPVEFERLARFADRA